MMKNEMISILALTLVLCNGCTDIPESVTLSKSLAINTAASISIPVMKERKVSSGPPDEQDLILDAYDNARIKLERQPENLASWLKMAEVFITEARVTGEFGYNYSTALDILDEVKDRSAGQIEVLEQALTLEALIRLSQHQFEEALALGERVVSMNPHRAFNHGILVDANVELGNYDQAVKASDVMVSTRPDLRSYSRVSYLREIHGELDGAIQAMDMAVKAGYPGFEETSWCRVMLGDLYESQGDLQKAEQQYRMALEERTNYPFALAALGRINLKLKNFDKAEEQLNKAIHLRPDAGFYSDLAWLYRTQGKQVGFEAARRSAKSELAGLSSDHSQHAHEHKQTNTHHHEHVGDSRVHGHSHEVGLEMAQLEFKLFENYDAALQNLEFEVARRPNNIEVNRLLAAVYYVKGDIEHASSHIEKAQNTGSRDAFTLGLSGLIKIAEGDRTEGIELASYSLEQDPYQYGPIADEMRKWSN